MIEEVKAQKYTCDNPTCGLNFTVLAGNDIPGLTGTINLGTLSITWFAHTFRCIGPAARARFDMVTKNQATIAAAIPQPIPHQE